MFSEEELKIAMQVDRSINEKSGEIYQVGIERQGRNGTVTGAQANAIAITHKKIAKVLLRTPAASTGAAAVATRIDLHLGNLIGEMQALRALFKEMQ